MKSTTILAAPAAFALAGAIAMAQCDPDLLATYDSQGQASGVHVEGDIAYVADGGAGLLILDVSDSTNPTFLGSINTMDEAMKIVVVDGLAYIADDTGGLRIIDVTDPTDPQFLGAYPTADQIFDVVVSLPYAYVVADQIGMQIVDVSDPTQPMLVSTISPAFEGMNGIGLEGTTVYTVGRLFNRFEAFDVSDPTAPASIWFLTLPDVGWKVDVAGGLAYVACNNAGVLIYDVAGPQPMQIGTAPTKFSSFDVELDGDTLYVAQNTGGVDFVDVSDPTMPQVLGSVDPPGFTRGVGGLDGTAYGAGDLVGLHIIGCGCAADVNGDGNLNILDFVAFQGLFQMGDPGADCDGNGLFNILDFVCYQGKFQAGCN
jgi:hypothetical protein